MWESENVGHEASKEQLLIVPDCDKNKQTAPLKQNILSNTANE